jgi:nucleotide-binding universal stress UspA family protein
MSTIVVGVDGSPGSRAALRWALNEARLRGSTVRAVHAWSLPHVPATTSGFVPVIVESVADAEASEQASRQVLDDAVAELAGDELPVAIERRLVQGPPAHALIAAAADAELLVVGSRGLGGFKELLLGSVSHQCAHHASCPVVIVREPST